MEFCVRSKVLNWYQSVNLIKDIIFVMIRVLMLQLNVLVIFLGFVFQNLDQVYLVVDKGVIIDILRNILR